MPPPAIERWKAIAKSRDMAGLDALLADDVVFTSPVVRTPQRGKPITLKYLTAALAVLGGDAFRYGEEWIGESSAVLEFFTIIDGVKINGADFIGWNAAGEIESFKVMVRPLKAIQAIHQAMGARLAGGAGSAG
ncbi:nuclear transport factor 2 family protein [Methylocapsa sp. S129]|uniref:nuclear transport factor 2 family protein n=1 Tax=Methylocapsa sp. S129 TaxID=1641869 RepID=UPI00131C1BBF|nr:nuclear transport factor 2 family protein [Methylocapsa sp. S129]